LGFLKFKENKLFFDNIVTDAEIDRMTITSCNTDFKANKWFMTNFRKGQDIHADIEVSSVHEIISRAATSRTPYSVASRLKPSLGQVSHRSNSIAAKADPNTIPTQKEKIARTLE
jgi:hypothetical protein